MTTDLFFSDLSETEKTNFTNWMINCFNSLENGKAARRIYENCCAGKSVVVGQFFTSLQDIIDHNIPEAT